MQTNKVKPAKQLHDAFPCISIEPIEELMQRDLLHIDGDKWRLGDESNGTTRKLSWRKYKRADTTGSDWHRLIGLSDAVRNDRRQVLLAIEGSKDALAAAELAHRAGLLPQTGILCALGSGYRPIRSELEQLRGRPVLLVPDNDAAGVECANIVAGAMLREKVDFTVWNWSQCSGNAKDLYDLLSKFPESAERQFRAVIFAKAESFFLPPSPSYGSTVQQFNSSTNKLSLDGDLVLGIVSPFIVTAKGTGNIMSFRLARAIKNRKLSTMQIEEIVELWFEKSKALLPPDADELKSLRIFHRQMKRVRFTEAALHTAIERARTAKLPFIATRDGDREIELLAALCRELQRDARDKPFICPVNVVQKFLNLRFATAANRLIYELEDEGVIECVDRGAPNRPGSKGKPTMWRYKLPIKE